MEVTMISDGVEISIAEGVAETKDALTALIFFFFFFSNHMFIVSTVQEMTCIFNDMVKTKPKIKLTIHKRNKHSQFPQRDQKRRKAAVAK